jgi:hypothetical protein
VPTMRIIEKSRTEFKIMVKPNIINLLASPRRIRQLAPFAVVLLGAIVAVAAYLQALDYPFVSDDIRYIPQNTKLAGLHLSELWRLFTEPYNTAFEFLPLRELSYWFDITLFGLNPAAFRVHNIILFLLCLPLVYATTLGLWRYFRPADAAGAPWAAAVVTALFALHPSHTEAVVWIAGRKDVLSTLFSLLALWLAMCARRERGLSVPYATATLVALLAAMLSKASAVAVAPVISILWIMFWRDTPTQNRRHFLLLWPLASLLLAACIAMIFAAITTQRVPFYFGVEAVTRSLAVLGWLARLAVTPESRHFFYPVLEDPYLPVMVVLGAAVLLAAAVVSVVVMLRKRLSLEGFAIVVFLLLCTPSIQLIPYAPPSLVSDRWLALAMWPVLLLIVVLAWRLKPMPRAILLLVLALSWSFQTTERTRDWRSFDAMVDSDIRAYPGYYMPAMHKIIFVQLSQGLYREASETANSISVPEFRDVMIGWIKVDYAVHVAVSTGKPQEAMTLLWEFWLVHKQPPALSKWNLPIIFFWKERQELLKNKWKFLAERFPDDVSVRYNAGLWLLGTHYEAAEANLRAAVESQRLPESVRGTAFKNFGLALMENGHAAEAETPLRTALEQSPPDFRAYCLLSVVYKLTGRLEEAARAEAECRSRARNEEAGQ